MRKFENEKSKAAERSTAAPEYFLRKLNRIHRTSMVSVGEVFVRGGGVVGPRTQNRYELLCCLEGRVIGSIDSVGCEVNAGEIMLLKPGHTERFEFDASVSNHHQCWCISRKELLPANLFSALSELPAGHTTPASQEFSALLELALSVRARQNPSDVQFYEHFALSLFFEFVRMADRETQPEKPGVESLYRAVGIMEQFFQAPLQLADIAVKAGVSPNHLIRLFRERFGTTPMRYLWNLRVQRGAELLRSSILNIAEISAQVGFRSQFHFSRAFKDAHGGLSPLAFRKRFRQSESLIITTRRKTKAQPLRAVPVEGGVKAGKRATGKPASKTGVP